MAADDDGHPVGSVDSRSPVGRDSPPAAFGLADDGLRDQQRAAQELRLSTM
jgi:hypothetical protein